MNTKNLVRLVPRGQRREAVRLFQRLGLLPMPVTKPRIHRLEDIKAAQRLSELSLPQIAGGARVRDMVHLPPLTAQPNSAVTATQTDYYIVPTGSPFIARYLVICQEADADFTTGDEDVSFAIDYTLDGATWVAVASAATLGGTIDGDQFLQFEPVTLPATVAAQKITTMGSSQINVRVPPESVVRVVQTIAGTTPDFQDCAIYVMGNFA